MAQVGVPTPETGQDDHGHDHHGPLHHQFEDLDQQNESYVVGMWTFLVTEIMFFGAFFLMYALYRWKYQTDFYLAHTELKWQLGAVNTVILLFSSFTMALAVRGAQLKNKTSVLANLGITLACAFGFLVIKYFEYADKFSHNLFPGPGFTQSAEAVGQANINHAQIYFSLYFAMTGLHGFHVVCGIIAIGILMKMWWSGNPLVTEDFVPTEMVGLYWHLVDLVWIYLYPLMYLIPATVEGAKIKPPHSLLGGGEGGK